VQVYALQDGRLEPRGIASGPARAPFVHGSDFYVVQRGCVARVELQATPPRPDSPIDEERCRAVDDLVARGGKPAVVELTRLAADPVAYVRQAATWALARIEVAAAATALVAAFGDRDVGAQRAAECGVERLGSAAREALLLGLPLCAVFDRPKTVAFSWHSDGTVTEWNSTFALAATEIGFVPEVCWAYAPNQKGAVEQLVKWVKGAFFKVLDSRVFHALGVACHDRPINPQPEWLRDEYRRGETHAAEDVIAELRNAR
jgi:hypothetical protein